jgi:signal peptidase I
MEILFIILVLIIYFFRKTFFIVTVSGQSMEPTFSGSDKLLVCKLLHYRLLSYGSIVLLTLPTTELFTQTIGKDEVQNYHRSNSFYVKRIIGLPGQVVVTSLHDLDPSLIPILSNQYDKNDQRSFVIPAKHYFVKGDAPGLDSTVFGPIPQKNIVGVVLLKLKSQLLS